MLKLLIDTCVWIDLAKDRHQHQYLRALDMMVKEGTVTVILPPLVREEFAKNKDTIRERNTASISGALRRAKEVIDQHGQGDGKAEALDQLHFVDQRLPLLGDLTGITAFVELMLAAATPIPVSDGAKLRAVDRGLQKKAPFHSKKNSVADAILVEAFAELVSADKTEDRFGFVTHNKNDFSLPNGDIRKHHPDFDSVFTAPKARYFATLKDALLTAESAVLDDLNDDFEEHSEQPRPTDEIVELIGELLDKVWYNRHKFREEQVEAGEIELKPYTGKYDPNSIDPKIWEGAIASAKRLEQKYGLDELGPWDDFEWGMLNGKLSALRWIFGEDWETTLDT
ncbi:Uncharacterized protein OS=Bacillus cereus BAG6O-2 GN=IEM_05527 PE=4 SV=1 [Gemmataceae bacterium]|nr:Uncharacterized protein OS=Bacillus cereus BAG6O-2 GN=IEM_05527 PE=4 SV=1 [Gemmataceae bacterium]VTU02436.1 Uncharacterized protein OS=Bacillus cereus BAG6O-2 GN=IEM_05527 PE=4 SV=1 [Gemmataceae bacterium]